MRGNKSPSFKVLQICGLPHDMLASEFVAALLEHLNNGLRDDVAIDSK